MQACKPWLSINVLCIPRWLPTPTFLLACLLACLHTQSEYDPCSVSWLRVRQHSPVPTCSRVVPQPRFCWSVTDRAAWAVRGGGCVLLFLAGSSFHPSKTARARRLPEHSFIPCCRVWCNVPCMCLCWRASCSRAFWRKQARLDPCDVDASPKQDATSNRAYFLKVSAFVSHVPS